MDIEFCTVDRCERQSGKCCLNAQKLDSGGRFDSVWGQGTKYLKWWLYRASRMHGRICPLAFGMSYIQCIIKFFYSYCFSKTKLQLTWEEELCQYPDVLSTPRQGYRAKKWLWINNFKSIISVGKLFPYSITMIHTSFSILLWTAPHTWDTAHMSDTVER